MEDTVHTEQRFWKLFNKAETQQLTKDETIALIKILDQVDFSSICIKYAKPHYIEGILLRKTPVWRVEWCDGEKMNIPTTIANPLSILNEGDQFGAFVKWDKNNKIKLIERVSSLELCKN